MIGFRALKAGQKRMVDVDATAGELRHHGVRQNLHVAGEDDEIGLRLLDDRCKRRFLARFVVLADR